MQHSRPKWLDSRLDWFPEKGIQGRRTVFREVQPGDGPQIKRTLHISDSRLSHCLRHFGYSLWVAARNSRNLVGAAAAKHDERGNYVTHWWHAERFENPQFMWKLFALVALEQPELPTSIWVDASDRDTIATMRDLEWPLAGVSDTQNLYRALPWHPYPVMEESE